MKGICDMFRVTASRHQQYWIGPTLLIVLTAIILHGMTAMHHVTDRATTPASLQHHQLHEHYVGSEIGTALPYCVPIETRSAHIPHRERPKPRVLCASIFHPPRAS